MTHPGWCPALRCSELGPDELFHREFDLEPVISADDQWLTFGLAQLDELDDGRLVVHRPEGRIEFGETSGHFDAPTLRALSAHAARLADRLDAITD